jgi:hypothetical protein
MAISQDHLSTKFAPKLKRSGGGAFFAPNCEHFACDSFSTVLLEAGD